MDAQAADGDQIAAVVTNLIDNAVRFTPGKGDVEIAVWRIDGEGGYQ